MIMNIGKYSNFIVAVIIIFVIGCDTDSGKSTVNNIIEYHAEDLAYDDDDSYTERYVLYTDEGTYERYIGGIYRGKDFGDIVLGTLFETGTYERDTRYGGIWFSSKKSYDFEKERLVNLGMDKQERFWGKVSTTSLTIEWHINNKYIPITYKLK